MSFLAAVVSPINATQQATFRAAECAAVNASFSTAIIASFDAAQRATQQAAERAAEYPAIDTSI